MFVASVVSMEYFYNNLSCIKTMKALAYPRLVCIVWSMAHFYVFLLGAAGLQDNSPPVFSKPTNQIDGAWSNVAF